MNFSESWVQRQTSYKLPIVPTYSRNGIDNHRIAEKTRTENILQNFLIYLFKKLFRLFLEIAPLYKKQITLYNMCAVPWGCSVPWGLFSTVGSVQYHGDIMIHVGIS